MTERKEVKLDSALRAELLGVLPFSTEGEHRFTPDVFLRKGEKGAYKYPEELRPVYVLASMNTKDQERGKRLVQAFRKDGMDECEKETYQLVADHLIRWENVYDLGRDGYLPHTANGKGRTDVVEVEKLPAITVGRLLFEILKISGLIDIEKLSLGF